MSNSSKGSFPERDCTEKCKSRTHGTIICAAITKRAVSDAALCAFLRWQCTVCGQVCDAFGRTALHLAASCGRTQLLEWLIRVKHANINIRDLESGYTPLHRSLFYGKINAAVALIKLGANMNLMDYNDLTPLDHAMKDRLYQPTIRHETNKSSTTMNQVYVWGTNSNYTLGMGSENVRPIPELLDSFHKKYSNASVTQVCLSKFHSVFVCSDGRVFACGHGQGGRLGLNTEQTIIIPQVLQCQPFHCVQAAIGRDHSIFLSESGQVWSCGLNTHHVLGVKPAPVQLLTPKPLAEFRTKLTGVCTGRFHSVAWGAKAVYTWGLNAGQLGHAKTGNVTYVTPKQISNFWNDNVEIVTVAASDGATVVATKRGDIFICHEYQCKRIASRQLNIKEIIVVGGHLNSKINNDLTRNGGHELRVLVLQTNGNLLIWQESWPQLIRCIYTLNRPLIVRNATLSRNELFFVTNDGEAFKGEFRNHKKKQIQQEGHKVNVFHEFLNKDECQFVKITKFPSIHRAVSIQCDLKGRNFVALQVVPQFSLINTPIISAGTLKADMLNLLNDSDEMDSMHDVIIKCSDEMFPLHRYIIASNSEPLDSLIEANRSDDNIVELMNLNPIIFKQILIYMYTGTCDFLTYGKLSVDISSFLKNTNFNHHIEIEEEEGNNVTAYEFYQNNKKLIKNKENNRIVEDPIKLLQNAAVRFGMMSLSKKLDNYYIQNGYVLLKNKSRATNKTGCAADLKFNRTEQSKLYDVIIRAKNNAEILAHKCVLAARLEYFNNLFALRWNPESSKNVISLPISNTVLKQVIDFLYTDNIEDLKNCDVIDYVISVLIVSDQLFITRLKEACETALSNMLNLKNTHTMLQLAHFYHANQLKQCTMEFICFNLSAVLESRLLETLEANILNELTDYYCQWNPIMSHRVITPYENAPCDELVNSINDSYPVDMSDCDTDPTQRQAARKKIRVRKFSQSKNKTTSESETEIVLNEMNDKNEAEMEVKVDENWVRILSEKEKHKKIIQARLNAISLAHEMEIEKPIEMKFTKLSSSPKSNNSSPESSFITATPPTSPSYSYDISSIKVVQKLSQKQRKKLAAGTIGEEIEKKSIITNDCDLSPKNPWRIIEAPPQLASSPDLNQTFSDIVSDEKKQKENWSKMRTKSLLHIQMEDKAIRELERFYNIDNVYDEYITIHKVEKATFAAPLWVHANVKRS